MPLLVAEIPILLVAETRDVAIHKNKLCALVVQIAVDIVPLGDGRQPAVVEQPDHLARPPDVGHWH